MEIKENEKEISKISTENNINNNFIEEEKNRSFNNDISIYLDSEILPIIDILEEMGYNKIYSKRLLAFYHPKTIEEAMNYFLKEEGIIQHFYIEDRKSIDKLCFLCGEQKEIHLGNIPKNNNEESDIFSNILINELINEDNNINKDLISKNDINIINDISIKKEECPICMELYIPNEENTINNCGHTFCNDCWFNSLSLKIKENQLSSIKCLKYECQEKLPDEFILKIIKSNKELIDKYKRYKYELDIINDSNKKFCPYPECNSYAELKNIKNKYVKCLNKHEFCFLCLEKPHGTKPCKENDILDKSLEIFAKNNFLKKCPHCSIVTEKIKGCNHITCAKCQYQWCWLCNGKYEPEHFRKGKCKGFQFFRPKNENDIKLAFEGKIKLNESQRQEDLEYNDIITHRRTHRHNEREEWDDFDYRRRPRIERRRLRRNYEEEYFRESKLQIMSFFFIALFFGNIFLLVTKRRFPKYLRIQFIFIIIIIIPYAALQIYLNIINLLVFRIKKKILTFLFKIKLSIKGERIRNIYF